jgi:uncharacterized protein YjbI with pentapeptide repeats
LRGADLRESELAGADFADSDLSDATLANADLAQLSLDGADLRGVELRSVKNWRGIKGIKGANILGVKNAPEGFVEWAKKSGAVESN